MYRLGTHRFHASLDEGLLQDLVQSLESPSCELAQLHHGFSSSPGHQSYELMTGMHVCIEKAIEWQSAFCCAKLDVAKAIDSVSHPQVFAALQGVGVSDDLARVIAREYVCTAFVQHFLV